ncbi:MAG: NYN domain-containing protein [Lawsonella clevelandensis]|uniref:NYN domain-containing protein n=1 Tax=Lawsonella clevelandensis TaxID=1528099 RepID=A0A2W5KGD2_9ACTN|nr:MAG: NYN domain-containing protein [Lawsonella clevelandensis]
MVDRVEVFVDTSYLLASFYNSWTTGARAQLEIDLPAVTDHLNTIVSNKLHLPVHRQLWYDGIPDSGPHRYQRTLRHIDGVQLRAGQLIEWGDRRTQKAVDTRLVADMVLRSIRGLVSDIVLVSGDADMIPGVEAAIDHGVRVHLIGFGWDSISNSLRSACDTVTVLDPREDFADCMHIDVLDPFHTDNTSEHSDLATDGQTNGPADSGTGNHSEQGNSDISSPVSSSDAANTTGSTAGNTGEGTAADMPGDMAHSSTATHPYASTGDTADEDENTDGANVPPTASPTAPLTPPPTAVPPVPTPLPMPAPMLVLLISPSTVSLTIVPSALLIVPIVLSPQILPCNPLNPRTRTLCRERLRILMTTMMSPPLRQLRLPTRRKPTMLRLKQVLSLTLHPIPPWMRNLPASQFTVPPPA